MLQNVNQNIPYILCKKIDENGINNQLNYKSNRSLQKQLSLKNYGKQYISTAVIPNYSRYICENYMIQTFSVLDINKKTDALNENYYKTDTQNCSDMLSVNISGK